MDQRPSAVLTLNAAEVIADLALKRCVHWFCQVVPQQHVFSRDGCISLKREHPMPVGLLASAILVVNNVRDVDTDRRAGKRTLAVKLGRPGARRLFAAMLVLAFAAPIAIWAAGGLSAWILLSLVSAPLAVPLLRTVTQRTDGASLNRALAATGQLLALFSLLLAGGVLLS